MGSGGRDERLSSLGGGVARRPALTGLVRIGRDAPAHVEGAAVFPEQGAQGLEQVREEVVADPVPHELVARAEQEDLAIDAVELNAREPLIERRG